MTAPMTEAPPESTVDDAAISARAQVIRDEHYLKIAIRTDRVPDGTGPVVARSTSFVSEPRAAGATGPTCIDLRLRPSPPRNVAVTVA